MPMPALDLSSIDGARKPDDPPSPKPENSELTVDELIRSQLHGKLVALGRYDSILWKIRTGYVLALYAVVTVLTGKESQLAANIGSRFILALLVAIVWGLSLSAAVMDLSFLHQKLRVVLSRNQLSDHALKLATGTINRKTAAQSVRRLIHISGEGMTKVPRPLLKNAYRILLVLYLANPIVISLVCGCFYF